MNFYLQLLEIAFIVCFIVDASGFTKSWRSLVAFFLKTTEQNLKPLKPFDCSTCMTWWTTLAYSLITGHISVVAIASCALLALLAFPIGQLCIFIREALATLIGRMQGWL